MDVLKTDNRCPVVAFPITFLAFNTPSVADDFAKAEKEIFAVFRRIEFQEISMPLEPHKVVDLPQEGRAVLLGADRVMAAASIYYSSFAAPHEPESEERVGYARFLDKIFFHELFQQAQEKGYLHTKGMNVVLAQLSEMSFFFCQTANPLALTPQRISDIQKERESVLKENPTLPRLSAKDYRKYSLEG